MSNFNSADIAAFKDVWVFCEQREGKLMPTDFELISKGRDLANELGVNQVGLLIFNLVVSLDKLEELVVERSTAHHLLGVVYLDGNVAGFEYNGHYAFVIHKDVGHADGVYRSSE